MISKVLVKLIDKAILPAILLLATRIISVVLVSKYFNSEFELSRSGFVFGSIEEYVRVNSYSALVMVVMLVIGLLFVLIKSLVFHESHIKPNITSKLFSLKMYSLIQNSFDLYTQGAIWLSYAYLLLIVNGVMTLSGVMYKWVFFITLGVTVVSTVLFALDVDEEIKIEKEDKGHYDVDSKYLQ
ncbi:MAG: hypothetical protein WAX66_00570 [Patescibacteria group bacterium]